MSTPIFVHVPKTAGSSIRTLITANYSPDQLLNLYGSFPEIFSACRERIGKLAGIKLVQGHTPYGTHYYLGARAPSYFCFLREPVARTLSDIIYAQRSPGHGFHRVFADPDLTLGQRIEQAQKILYYRNNMTHFVSGNFYLSEITSAEYGRAVDNLWHSAFVGVTEQFEESLLIMARRLGWRQVVPQVSNVTPKTEHPTPTEEDLALCRSFLRFDLSLYEVALDIFRRDCLGYGDLLVEAAQQMREILADQLRQNPDLSHKDYQVGMQLKAGDHAIPPGSPLARWLADAAADPS